ncbi:DoxX family protein [Cohnella herbarum]|uniref:DoxX family protein n=1 Tax=Cohnella herbarum TaxID=2728023 RepID=A0A7Z2ZP52_9BACL|nr:DoxX family protein [Cohnella herbarum]QJD86978.1 DoxX family protein [Cohnella herbarum]
MTILSVILQCLLIFAFSFSGASKIAGASMQVQVFNHLKIPQWFRIVTGFVQLAGVVGLVAGFWDTGMLSLAALWIACTMLGAVLFHMRAGDSFKQFGAPLLLTLLSLTLALLHI